MTTNTDITLYHYCSGVYQRTYIGAAHWFSKRITTVTDDGVVGGDVITIRIPMDKVPEGYQIHNDDIVVRGCHEDLSSRDDLIGVEEWGKVADFSVNENGLNPHIRIGVEK